MCQKVYFHLNIRKGCMQILCAIIYLFILDLNSMWVDKSPIINSKNFRCLDLNGHTLHKQKGKTKIHQCLGNAT